MTPAHYPGVKTFQYDLIIKIKLCFHIEIHLLLDHLSKMGYSMWPHPTHDFHIYFIAQKPIFYQHLEHSNPIHFQSGISLNREKSKFRRKILNVICYTLNIKIYQQTLDGRGKEGVNRLKSL